MPLKMCNTDTQLHKTIYAASDHPKHHMTPVTRTFTAVFLSARQAVHCCLQQTALLLTAQEMQTAIKQLGKNVMGKCK